jgi:8-oxo-dGTP diphosphatase
MTPSSEDNLSVLRKVALAHFKDKKILMVRDNKNDKVFYNLGGKVEEGETDIQCLAREVKEELEVDLDLKSLEFLGEFEAPAHGKHNASVNIRLYKGGFTSQPRLTDEIVEFSYLDSSVSPENLSPISIDKIFPWLREHGYIN